MQVELTIKQEETPENLHELKGSVWRDQEQELNVFCQVGIGMFSLISLNNWNRLHEPSNDLAIITKNCTKVCDRISIKKE